MALLDLFRRKPTIERLAQDIVEAGARAGETGWRFEPSSRSLVRDGTDGVVHLENLFLEYRQAPLRVRRALLDKYVALLAASRAEIPRLWTMAAKHVYAVIRSRYDAIGLELADRATGRRLPARVEHPWHGDLVVRIAYDFGASLGQVREDLAAVWGVSPDDLLERAIRNLCALPRPAWEPVAPGVFQLVSAASYAMFPRSYIWFGVLHAIAVSLVVARPWVDRPLAAAAVGAALVAAGLALSHPAFDNRALGWLGFMTTKPVTADYVPLFPWTGVLLIGIAVGHWLLRARFAPLAPLRHAPAALRWLGRHSLIIYLVHQPLLIGLLWIALRNA